MKQIYEFDAVIHEVPDNGGAYVVFPWNIREEFGKGRVKVYAEFDSILVCSFMVCAEAGSEKEQMVFLPGRICCQRGSCDSDRLSGRCKK